LLGKSLEKPNIIDLMSHATMPLTNN